MVQDAITNTMLEQIKEIEKLDESQVLSELAGDTIQEFIYEIKVTDPKTKQKVSKVKLSWAGVKEVARSRGNIILERDTVEELPDAFRVIFKATDLKRNFTVFGGCHQPKRMKIKIIDRNGVVTGDNYEDDPYAFQKGLSKAQRNALNLCIPGEYIAKFLSRFSTESNKPKTQIPKTTQTADKSSVKNDWDNYDEPSFPNLAVLERIYWHLTKKQPAVMYKELGVESRADITESPYACFLKLKELNASA